MSSSEFDPNFEMEGIHCETCESRNVVPLWDEISMFEDGQSPDFIGCIDCQNKVKAKEYSAFIKTRIEKPK